MKPRTKPALAPDSLACALLRAAEIIAGVIAGRNLDSGLAACWQTHAPAPGPRGAVQDLAYGTLRQYGRGDFLLSRLLRSALQDTPGKTAASLQRALLLAALYRLESHDGDTHTTVDQAVNASACVDQGQFKALTNAVLRNFLRRKDELLSATRTDPVACHQHPLWWIDRIRAAYPAEWQDILAAGNTHPPMTLRVNCQHSDGPTYLRLLQQAGIGATLLAEAGPAILLEHPQGVDKLPGFADGALTVQDWGAQRAAPLLDARDGMRVLDACAAPGGKTTHLLELADIDLLALDAEPARSARIVDNLRRLGLQAQVKTADCCALDTWWDRRPFERILADVPCSASGVVRRHPDSKWLRRATDIAGFARSQAEILEALWHVLAPGGKMLYCTCSLFPEENELQIASFAARHADALRIPLNDGAARGDSLQWQVLPQAEQDGFFYALVQKHR
ncbi:MAG: 16S rRNA (cytosine(967)-C(5))-methyltransferase RsmB [Proteobacteria bacterium]|nr:16S rRNA (cytosine(967)-C(5))-methyltransferase RsmB [Pseudomonadota bacterium]